MTQAASERHPRVPTRRDVGPRWIVVLFAILALLAGVLFFTQRPLEARHRPWTGPHVTSDGWYYYHTLRSMVLDGDLDLANEYQEFGNWYGFGNTALGRPASPFGVGPALLWTPGFVLGHAFATFEEARAPPWEKAHGYSPCEQAGALATSLLAALATMAIVYRFLRRTWGPACSALASLGSAVGGPLVWYGIYEPSMPHAFDAFCVSSFFLVALSRKRRESRLPWKRAVLLGSLAGIAILIRPQNAVLLAIAAEEYVWHAIKLRHRRSELAALTLRALFIPSLALVVFFFQMYAWKVTYGHWIVVPQGPMFMRWTASMWSEVLFSSRNGLFTTTPLLWVSALGLVLGLRPRSGIAVTFIAFFAFQAYVNGAAWDWWGGGSYGGRRMLGCHLPLAYGLAMVLSSVAFRKLGKLRQLPPMVLLSAFLFPQMFVLRAYANKEISRDDPRPMAEKVKPILGHIPAAVVSAVGNPFALPANLWFAMRHGVHPSRYDEVVGPYFLSERLPTTNPLRPLETVSRVRFDAEESRRWLGRGFLHEHEKAFVASNAFELFIPLNRPGDFTLDLYFEAPLRFDEDGLEVSLNDEATQRFDASKPPRIRVTFDASSVARGVNVVRVDHVEPGTVLRSMTVREGTWWPKLWREMTHEPP